MTEAINVSTLATQIWLIGSVAVAVAISLYFYRRIANLGDFYIAGMSIPAPVVGFSIAATSMSGWGYIGGPGEMFAQGMGGMPVVEVSILLGIVLGYRFLAPQLRQLAESHGALTAADLGEILYRSNAPRVAMAVGSIVGLTAYLAANFLAIALLIQMVFNISHVPAVIIGAVIVTLYSMVGGRPGAMWVDFFQGIFMVFGSLLGIYVIYKYMGGYGNIFTVLSENPEIPSSYLSILDSLSIPMLLSYVVVFSLGYMGLPQVITQFFTIKTASHLKWALPTTLIVYSFMIAFEFIGYGTRYGVAELGWPAIENSDLASFLFVGKLFPSPVQGLMYAVMLAAILSTTTSLLIVGSSSIARDLYQRWILVDVFPNAAKFKNTEVALARGATIMFALVALAIVINPPDVIVWLGALGWGILAATTLVPILAGLYWDKATASGATWAAAIGLLTSLVTGIADVGYKVDIYIHSGCWGIIASVIAMYFVSKATHKAQ